MQRSRRRSPVAQQVDWAGLAQVMAVLFIICGIYVLYRVKVNESLHREEVKQWLDDIRMGELNEFFHIKGIKSMENVYQLKTQDMDFTTLSSTQRNILHLAQTAYVNRVHLQDWLKYNSLIQYMTKLSKLGVVSLHSLAILTESDIRKVTSGDLYYHDYMTDLVEQIKTSPPTEHELQMLHSLRVQHFIKEHKWTLFGLAMLFIWGVLLLKVFSSIEQGYTAFRSHVTRTTQSTSTSSIYNFFTGNYLAPDLSSVTWGWDDLIVVGKTMSFDVKFKYLNGRAYPISDADHIKVEILVDSDILPATVQLGGPNPDQLNNLRATFTAHRAATYKISIMVGPKHIWGSPFVKKFLPGTMDPQRSKVVTHSAIVVVKENQSHDLFVEPRDQWNNFCGEESKTCGESCDYVITLLQRDTSEHREVRPSLRVTPDEKVALHCTPWQSGCYQATVTHCGVQLKNGVFHYLVLTEDEDEKVNTALRKRSHNLYYEARLLKSPNSPQKEKPKKVYCYISPKQLTIKEYYWKIFPKKLFTFRLNPSTKFQFLGLHNQYAQPVFTMEDSSQVSVQLLAKERNIIVATYTGFLLKNIGGSETFVEKRDFFYQELRQKHRKYGHSKLEVVISRDSLLESSYNATKSFSTSDWCRNFEITFRGEQGLDWGGVRREWIEVLCRELFDPHGSGLFVRFKDDPQALVLPNPNRPAHLKSKHYEFAGRIVGKCLYESALGGSYRQLVKARFTRSFLAQLIGLSINYKYFEQDDPDLYVSKVKYIEDNEVEDMELTFAEDEYKDGRLVKTVDLIPYGSKVLVNEQNKLEYLNALARYRLCNQVEEEVEAFLKGLGELVPDALLSMFDENELELLMCGTGVYSVTDFRENHSVCTSPGSQFSLILDWFWTIVSGFTQEEMARLLQFTTGCSQLPPGGFAHLNPHFQIMPATSHANLPTAHTCFNELCLPTYDSLQQMHQMLLLAINEGNQGFGMA